MKQDMAGEPPNGTVTSQFSVLRPTYTVVMDHGSSRVMFVVRRDGANAQILGTSFTAGEALELGELLTRAGRWAARNAEKDGE